MLNVQMEQRVNLKFLVKLEKTFTEAYAMLKRSVIDCLFRTQVFEWFKRFKEGHETIKNDPRSGRPSTSKTDENNEKVTRFLLVMNRDFLLTTPKQNVEAVKAKATEVLNQLTEVNFQHCFQQEISRMERCRDRQGEYIEGEKVATVIGNE
ncbi:hypothetical protein NQ318_011986 [Aromia moschata]|uniref:Mos1 transposase HTH domain-containing protein n=1 Tax=Aromia moschata TaxID=1265417 RepID=A0AAV8XXD5_9CUCU|nr:hypothetical protein NQ318_011986 [Aromia moschata]